MVGAGRRTCGLSERTTGGDEWRHCFDRVTTTDEPSGGGGGGGIPFEIGGDEHDSMRSEGGDFNSEMVRGADGLPTTILRASAESCASVAE